MNPQSANIYAITDVQTSGDAIVRLSVTGVIESWNRSAERMFGYGDLEAIGRQFSIISPRDRIAEQLRLIARVRSGHEETIETVRVRKDRRRLDVIVTVSPLMNAAGQVVAISAAMTEITNRKRITKDRRESERQLHVAQKGELDQTKEHLRALTARLIEAQEEERRRLARDLHDNAGQSLALMDLEVSRIQRLPDITERIGHDLELLKCKLAQLDGQLRELAHKLHPSILEHLGLDEALRQLVEDFAVRWPYRVDYHAYQVPPNLPLPIATALYRITQEALSNVVKHAPEAAVRIRVSGCARDIRLSIKDAGPGFDPNAARAGAGLGLIGMQERACLVGAKLRVRSVIGRGAEISVVVGSRSRLKRLHTAR